MKVFNSRNWALMVALCLFATFGSASRPAAAGDDKTVKNDAAKTASITPAAESSSTTDKDSAASPAPATVAPALPDAPVPRLNGSGTMVYTGKDEEPTQLPMPGYGGGLGLFTIRSGDTLAKGAWAFEGGANKFSRAPGSLTVLEVGFSVAVGLTDRFTLFTQFDPERHVHLGIPSELSLNSPGSNPPFGNSLYRSIVPVAGAAPAYVEDFPFASANGGGVGPVTIGLETGLLSELRGNSVSLNIVSEFFIPTHTGLTALLNSEGQSGAFDNQWGVNISKHVFDKQFMWTGGAAYRITRDPSFTVLNTVTGLTQTVKVGRADQVTLDAGFILFPEKRIQFMNEYSALIFVGNHTANTTFGARDPVDGVWGLRFYPTKWLSIDAGYRYMLNLSQVNDRNGFVLKVSSVYWPEKPKAPDNVGVSCSTSKASVVADSGDIVDVSARGTDTYNHPLNFVWMATGGKVDGTGPDVRWDSTGVAPGTYTISTKADDGHGNSAGCSSDVTVEAKPIPAPTMACAANPSEVFAGERAPVATTVADSSGTTLNYTWKTNGGQIVGSGQNVDLDTSGLSAGTYTVTGRVENGKGGAADCSTNVNVKEHPVAPSAKISNCSFKNNSAKVDNVCKRTLDDLATSLQNDPNARGVVTGYADPKEKKSDMLSKDRAENAKKYLSEKKGVSDSRIDTRSQAGTATDPKDNRKLDAAFVPQGATY
jgi:outer membrane protein OmpA-like peptidoglycan-associated protein